jgi:PAS domain S-box-containing protein
MNQHIKPYTTSSYDILTDNLQRLMQVQNTSEIYNLIGNGLIQAIPHSIAIINKVSNKEETTTTQGIYGLDKNLIFSAIKKLGINPVGTSYPLNPELLKYYKYNRLNAIPKGLSTFSNNAFPSKVLKEIEKILNIKKIYTTGLRKQGELFAIIHILKLKNSTIENFEMVQHMLNQYSIVLQNKLYQIELQQKEYALQTALDETKSSYLIWDNRNNQITYSNKLINSLGYQNNELKENIQQWENLVHPDDKKSIEIKVKLFIKERKPFQVEYRIKTKQNYYKWFEARFTIKNTPHFNQNEILIIHTDIDQSKKAEIALHNSKNRFQKLANLTNEGIIIHKNGVCIDLNNTLLEITGRTKNEFIGKDFLKTIRCKGNQLDLKELRNNGSFVTCTLSKNNNDYTVEVTNRQLDDNHDVFTIRDITELKEKEEQLKLKNKKLNEAIKLKNQFLKILSHDLKNPISSIYGIVELVCKNIENFSIEKIKSLLSSVAEESKNTTNLLTSMLIWSMKDDGKVKLNMQTVNLTNEVDELIAQFESQFIRKGLSITNYIPIETYVEADIQILQVIIRNIVGNAIKYTPRNGIIIIDSKSEESIIHLQIKNNGEKIPQSTIDAILKNSRIESRDGTELEKGSGFGLSIVNDLIHMHKSELWIESNKNYTLFSFPLPIAVL